MRFRRIIAVLSLTGCAAVSTATAQTRLAPAAAAQAGGSSAGRAASADFYPDLPARFWSHSHPALGWQTGWTGYVTEDARQCAVVGRVDDVLYMVGDLDSLELGGNALPFPSNRALDSVLALPEYAWHRADLTAIKKGFEGC